MSKAMMKLFMFSCCMAPPWNYSDSILFEGRPYSVQLEVLVESASASASEIKSAAVIIKGGGGS